MPHGQIFYNQIRSGGVNVQNASYNVQESDAFKLVVMYSTTSPAVVLTATLLNPPPSALWRCKIDNPANAPTNLIISRNGLLIDTAAANLTLTPGQGVEIYTDGTNYFAERGMGTGGGATINFADDETPSGTLNGSNTAFTLAHTPSPSGSLQLYLNGVLQVPGTDFTLSGASITMTVAPASTDTLKAWYRY